MKTTSSTSNEVLGCESSEVKGFSKIEIRNMIDKVQDGVMGEKLTEEEREKAVEIIFEEANN